jgi:hypothetical protein
MIEFNPDLQISLHAMTDSFDSGSKASCDFFEKMLPNLKLDSISSVWYVHPEHTGAIMVR